jgi:hypothetical protein
LRDARPNWRKQMMHEPKPESVAASLTATERILLFCIDSGTDWQKRPRITGATVTAMVVRGFVELDAVGGLTLTVAGRAVLGDLLKAD